MRRRAGMCSSWMRDIEACGWRFLGRGAADEAFVGGGGVVIADWAVLVTFVVVVAAAGGGSGGGGGVAVLVAFDADGGGAYVGCLGRKKFRIEDCPGELDEGNDIAILIFCHFTLEYKCWDVSIDRIQSLMRSCLYLP